MGLTNQSTGIFVHRHGERKGDGVVIALAGSPNVGKSTVFNALTGLHRHTGNWTGKTVSSFVGRVKAKGKNLLLADVPGMYSLFAGSADEVEARDFILFGGCDGVICVCDMTNLERNLPLVMQIAEYTPRLVVCLSLVDLAEKRGIAYDEKRLSELLGVPCVKCCARKKKGLAALIAEAEKCVLCDKSPTAFCYPEKVEKAVEMLTEAFESVASPYIVPRFTAIRMLIGDSDTVKAVENRSGVDFGENAVISKAVGQVEAYLCENGLTCERVSDIISATRAENAEKICSQCRISDGNAYGKADRIADRIFTGRLTAVPVMLAMLAVLFYLTVKGANAPSEWLQRLLFSAEDDLHGLLLKVGLGRRTCDMLTAGVYRCLAWVVSVMLPPMAIFFPLFTLLEDCGVLPRIAYNLDGCFAVCRASGKQALTMCMGFGCNAAGVTGCRIIDSGRERTNAILTNSFIPCNGKIPILIAISAVLFPENSGLYTVAVLTAAVTLAVAVTFGVSFILSKTLLRGEPGDYILEMPPYRLPKIGSVLVRSFLDRTVFVLGRAVVSAVPMGFVIWLLANVGVYGKSLLSHFTGFLDPFARIFGLDGVILSAFVLALPANELVIPVMIMAYTASSSLTAVSAESLGTVLSSNGLSGVTAVCVLVFSLFHFPCATTLLTIKKETGSLFYTLLSAIIPTAVGFAICFAINTVCRLF